MLGSRCTFPNPEICHLPPDLKVIQETESGEEEVEGDDVLGSAVRAVTGAAAVCTINRLMYLRASPPPPRLPPLLPPLPLLLLRTSRERCACRPTPCRCAPGARPFRPPRASWEK